MARPQRRTPWLSQRRGNWYVYWYDAEKRETKRRSLRTRNKVFAEEAFSRFAVADVSDDDAAPWRSWAVKMCRRARENAKQKGRLYAVSPEFVGQMLASQDYRCAVTGMRFSGKASYRNPFAPSLDQIKPGAGYTADNVRIVTVIANTAMNGWGELPLRRMILESRLADQPES